MGLIGSQDSGLGSVETAAGDTSSGGATGVDQIIPGAGISVSPPAGVGVVTITNSAPAPGLGSGVAGPTALGAAGVAATARRSDQTAAAYRSDLPLSATWFIDPANGSDARTNPGTTSATALATLQELKRRWWGAEITQATTVTVLGNCPLSDVGSWNFTINPGKLVTFVCFLGATTGFGGAAIDNTLYTGSVTAFSAATAAAGANDTELTDAAIPVSFTASGLLAAGVLFKRTSSTPLEWFALKDLGAKTIRINPPMHNNGVTLAAALAPGDTYSAFQLYTFPTQDFGAAARQILLDSLDDEGPAPELSDNKYAVRRRRNWIGGSQEFLMVGLELTNCCTAMGTGSQLIGANPEIPVQIQGGCARGTGAVLFSLFGRLGVSGGWVSQGVALAPNDSEFLGFEEGFAFFDCTIDCLQPVSSALINIAPLLTAGCGMSGLGNTAKLLRLTLGARLFYGGSSATPPFVAGASSDPAPIALGGASYAVAALPAVSNTFLTSAPATFPTPTNARTLLKFSGRVLAAATGDVPLADGGDNTGPTTGLTRPAYVPPAGTAVSLRVNPAANTNTNAINVAVYKNGAATGITVAVPAASTAIAIDLAHSATFNGTSDTLDVIEQTGVGGGGGTLLASAVVEYDLS